jgi:septal ring factor EnvC (AmiA/AmiB activator)
MISAKLTELAAEAASIEARAEQAAEAEAAATAAAADARIHERDAAMWRVLYEAAEQERMNLLGMIRGEQIP